MISVLNTINTSFNEVRATFGLLDTLQKLGPVKQGLGSHAPAVAQFFQQAKGPVEQTKVTCLAGLVTCAHKMTQEIMRPGEDQVAQTMSLLRGVRTMALATASVARGLQMIHAEDYFQNVFIKSAFHTLYTVATPIATVGTALAGVDFLSSAHELYKHIKFNRAWDGINPAVDNCKRIEMAKNLESREFKTIFGEEKDKMASELEELAHQIPEELKKTPDGKAKVHRRKILLEKLGQKMRSTKKRIYSALGASAAFTLGNWLSIGKIAPVASNVFKNIASAWQFTNNVSKMHLLKKAEAIQNKAKKLWNRVNPFPAMKARLHLYQYFAQVGFKREVQNKSFRARDIKLMVNQ